MSVANGVDARHLYSATINVVALYLCFLLTGFILDAVSPERCGTRVSALIHIGLAVPFTFVWYALVLAGFALGNDWLRGGVASRAFSENAMVWQLHQGLILYAVLILYRALKAERINRSNTLVEREPDHLLLRQGQEMFCVAPDEIVSISGAGDYSEIITRTSQFMSTKSLDHFERTLASVMVRIHRSHLVRIGAIERTEPAGNGRVQVHLINGHALTSSREGGKLLRRLVR